MSRAEDYARAVTYGPRFPGYAGLRVNAALLEIQRRQLEHDRTRERPAVWASPLVPSEILAAFGLTAVTPETVAAILASVGAGGTLLDRSGKLGLAEECCSFQRMAVAALEDGVVPVPDAFFAASSICDDNYFMTRYLANRHDRPAFLLDVPGSDDSPAQAYVVSRLEDMVRFLERLTGQPMDPRRLSEAVAESNRTRALWLEVNRLRRDNPPVMYGVAALRLAGGLVLQKLGLPELTAAMAGYAAELRERIAAEAFLPSKRRLLWLHLFPLFDGRFMRRIEVDLGLMVAFEESSHLWWDEIDPHEPLPGLARRILTCPLGGSVERRTAALVRLAEAYRVDGVVHFSHQGCKTLTGGAPLLARALRDAGLPVLELGGDCLDNRTPPTASSRTRIEAFAEMLG